MRSATYICAKCGWQKKDIFNGVPPQTVKCENGHRAERQFGRTLYSQSSKAWPMACEASGVMPYQIEDSRRADALMGIKCDYTPDGRRIFNDRGHRRDCLRALGLHDRDGGYGDG